MKVRVWHPSCHDQNFYQNYHQLKRKILQEREGSYQYLGNPVLSAGVSNPRVTFLYLLKNIGLLSLILIDFTKSMCCDQGSTENYYIIHCQPVRVCNAAK